MRFAVRLFVVSALLAGNASSARAQNAITDDSAGRPYLAPSPDGNSVAAS